MDTSQQVSDVVPAKSESLIVAARRRRSIVEKRRIVEETLVPGASVARVARAHGVNAYQVLAGADCIGPEDLENRSQR
jgi:transposase-like protein